MHLFCVAGRSATLLFKGQLKLTLLESYKFREILSQALSLPLPHGTDMLINVLD